MTTATSGSAGHETRPYLRIAAEEAWAPPELFDEYRTLLAAKAVDPGFESLMGYFLRSNHPQPRSVIDKLADLGPQRIADMDATGIDRQILGLTAPGTQVLDKAPRTGSRSCPTTGSPRRSPRIRTAIRAWPQSVSKTPTGPWPSSTERWGRSA